MVTSNDNVVAPKQLILPSKTTQVPSTVSEGTLFMSGTIVHYISGATLWKLNGTKV